MFVGEREVYVCVCGHVFCLWLGVKKIEEVIISKALCLCHVCAYCVG